MSSRTGVMNDQSLILRIIGAVPSGGSLRGGMFHG